MIATTVAGVLDRGASVIFEKQFYLFIYLFHSLKYSTEAAH